MNAEDWRSRDQLWELTFFAMDYFRKQIPFYEKKANHDLVDQKGAFCFQKEGEVYALYFPESAVCELKLEGSTNSFRVQWYDPSAKGKCNLVL